jgi:nucleoside-diphosphate-sugar epimerase
VSEGAWRNVLLTGAKGLLGRAIYKELAERNVGVNTPDELSGLSSHSQKFRVDLSKPDLDVASSTKFRPDAIIHAAAVVPHTRLEDTELNAQCTRQIDRNIQHAQRQWNIPCVYLSGCSLYQSRGLARCDERSSLKEPAELTPYLRAKRDGEVLFQRGNDAIIFRLSSPVGPGLSRTSVLSRFMHAARLGDILHVWGSGSREQDFIDVRDVARLVALCATHRRFGIFNVAAGVPTTMQELAERIVSVWGQGRVTVGHQEDPEEGKTSRYDVSSAIQAFGWKPRYSLQDCLKELYEFEKSTP